MFVVIHVNSGSGFLQTAVVDLSEEEEPYLM
jgi:hypothetical protein